MKVTRLESWSVPGPFCSTHVSVLQRASVKDVRRGDDNILFDSDWSQPSFWALAHTEFSSSPTRISVQIEGVL